MSDAPPLGTPALPLGAPRVVGDHYVLGALLGEGGFGAVYAAEHRLTGRRVAVKLLGRELSANREVAQRFLHEARAATSLAHPNVVDVLDMGVDEAAGAYLVMERLSGETLREHLERHGALSPREAIALLRPIVLALADAHAMGIVHRDLKPENVFLAQTRAGAIPKLLDFGIAKVTSQRAPESTLKTRAGAMMGTPMYMAPELIMAADEATAAADVWALGVMLYELVAGVRPFEGPTATALFYAISQGEYVLASRRERSRADAAVDAIIAGCLRRDASLRYPSARDLLAALDAHHTAAVPATVPPPVLVSASTATTLGAPGTVTAPAAEAPRPAPRSAGRLARPLVAMLAGAACVVGVWTLAGARASGVPSQVTLFSEFPADAFTKVVLRSVDRETGAVLDTEEYGDIRAFPVSFQALDVRPEESVIEALAIGATGQTVARGELLQVLTNQHGVTQLDIVFRDPAGRAKVGSGGPETPAAPPAPPASAR